MTRFQNSEGRAEMSGLFIQKPPRLPISGEKYVPD